MGLAILIKPAFDNLNPVKVGPDGIANRIDHEGRRLTLWRLSQITAHRDTFLIPDNSRLTGVDVSFRVIPATKQTNYHAWSGRCVDLLTVHGIEQRCASVFFGPHCGVARSKLLPGEYLTLLRLKECVR